MGGQKYYKAEGGFVQYLYHQVGIVTADNGISAKVVEKINKEDHAQGLPAYSNTSDIYLKKGKESGDIIQAEFIKTGKRILTLIGRIIIKIVQRVLCMYIFTR